MPQTAQWEKAKEIITGIAVTGLFFLFSVSLPVIGFISSLLIPLPVLYYRLKLGRNNGSIILAVSIVLISAIIGAFTLDFFLFTGLLLLGVLLSESIEMNLPMDKTILFSSILILVAGYIGLLFYSKMAGYTVFELTAEYIGKNLEMTIALYREMGMSEENILIITNSFSKIKDAIVHILPALITSAFFFIAWVNLLVARSVLKRKDLILFGDEGSLNHWKAPDYLVWGVIGCGVFLFMPEKSIKIIGFNGLIILMAIYFFQGISIVSFFCEKKLLPKALRVIIYSIIALQHIILLSVIIIGFFDVWANFRRIGLTEKDQYED